MEPDDAEFIDVSVPSLPAKKPFLSRLGERVGDLAIEFIGTFVAIGGIAIADHLVRWWLGEEKFFGVVPVQWVFDLGHISVLGRLIWRIFFPEKEQ